MCNHSDHTMSPAQPHPRQEAVENTMGMALLSLVWLVPNHQLPWSAFHHELLMVVALAAICGVLAWQTRWRLPVSRLAVLVLLAVGLPWLQWAAGVLPKSGTALVSSAYLAALALSIGIGQAAAQELQRSGRRFFDILFGALVLAAVLNVPVQWVQWFQWYDHALESLMLLLVTPINPQQRPSGMVLQPNQLATVQVWGLIGLSWFRYHRRIGLGLFLAGFAVVGFGIGLTQSRAGLLEMVLVCALLAVAWWLQRRRDIVGAWLVAIVVLVVWGLNFDTVAQWLGVKSEAVARLSAIDGSRVDAWRAFWAAVLERPWAGYGITDSGYAYVAVAHERPELFIGQRFAHAHNVVLDLFLWVGLPLGVLVLGAFGYWLLRRLVAVRVRPLTVFPLAMVLALGLHAMLELPHQFLYFIVPAGFCIGWLCVEGGEPHRATWQWPRWTWGAAGLGTVAVLTPIALDYFPYQARYTEWRYENARVGKRPDTAVLPPRVLNQLHDELVLYRLPLRRGMAAGELTWIADTARAVNSPPAFYAAAKAFALAGQGEEARRWMMRLNAIMDPVGVQQVQAVWRRDQAQFPELANLPWPGYQGRAVAGAAPSEGAVPDALPLPSVSEDPGAAAPR